MEPFDELSGEAEEITEVFEEMLGYMEYNLLISFKGPYHDIARRFLNEIVGFEPVKRLLKDCMDDIHGPGPDES